MSIVHDEIVETFAEIRNDVVRKLMEFAQESEREYEVFNNAIMEDILRYQETGTLRATFNHRIKQSTSPNSKPNLRKLTTIPEDDSLKENVNVKMSTRSTKNSKKKLLEEIPSTKMDMELMTLTNHSDDVSSTSQTFDNETLLPLKPTKQSKSKKVNKSRSKTKTSLQINKTIKREKGGSTVSTTVVSDCTNCKEDSDVKIYSNQLEVIELDDTEEVDIQIKEKYKPDEDLDEIKTLLPESVEEIISTNNNLTENDKRVRESESETESDESQTRNIKSGTPESEYNNAVFKDEEVQNIAVTDVTASNDSLKENANVKMSTRSTKNSKKKLLEEIPSTNMDMELMTLTNHSDEVSSTSQTFNNETFLPSKPIKKSRSKKVNKSRSKTKTSFQINKTSKREKGDSAVSTTVVSDSTNSKKDSDVKIYSNQLEVIELDDTEEVDLQIKEKYKPGEDLDEIKTLLPSESGGKIISTNNNLTENEKRVRESESETESDETQTKNVKSGTPDSEHKDAVFNDEEVQNIEVTNVTLSNDSLKENANVKMSTRSTKNSKQKLLEENSSTNIDMELMTVTNGSNDVSSTSQTFNNETLLLSKPIKQSRSKKINKYRSKTSFIQINKTSKREKGGSTLSTTVISDSTNCKEDSDVKIYSNQLEVIELDNTEEVDLQIKEKCKPDEEYSTIEDLDEIQTLLPESGKEIISTNNNLTENDKRVRESESETESDEIQTRNIKSGTTEFEYKDAAAVFNDEDVQNIEVTNVTVIHKKGYDNNLPDSFDLIANDDDTDKDNLEKRIRKSKKIFSPLVQYSTTTNSKKFITKTRPLKYKIAVKEQSKDAHKKKEATSAFDRGNLKENVEPVTPIIKLQKFSAFKTPILRSTTRNISNSTSKSYNLRSHAESQMALRKRRNIEANRKKENLMDTRAEVLRLKTAKQQLEALQNREAMKKEKEKALKDMDRKKLEKQRPMAKNEEKYLTQEMSYKTGAIKKSTAGKAVKNTHPDYLKYKTSLLPTENCYDSNDASRKTLVPTWQMKSSLFTILYCMLFVNWHKTVFFGSQPETPNLQSIFPSIRPSKLKRTSSAVWNRSGVMKLVDEMVDEDELDF